MKVFDRTLEGLAKSLDLRSEQQAIISANIANADTPGYQAQTIDFENALSKALATDGRLAVERSDPRHIASGGEIDGIEGELHNQINDVVREDGNTVDRDAEMTSLFQNQLLYNAAADLVKKKLGMIKYAISDGGSH